MSDLQESLKKLKYDKRMLNWNLRQKLVTEKEYEKHLEKLEDLSHLKMEDNKDQENQQEAVDNS